MDTASFFEQMPQALPSFEALVGRLRSELAPITIRIQKTQISLSNRHNFAFVWLPHRKVRGRPDVYIVVSFGLGHPIHDARIAEMTEPYPNRWTHHVIVQNESEIDGQLLEWLKQAYTFSWNK